MAVRDGNLETCMNNQNDRRKICTLRAHEVDRTLRKAHFMVKVLHKRTSEREMGAGKGPDKFIKLFYLKMYG